MQTADPTTLVEDYQHIWSSDAALDQEVDDGGDIYTQWLDTGDASLLEKLIKPGEKPMVFTIRHPRGRLRRQLRDLVCHDSKIKDGVITEWSETALFTVGIFSVIKVENLVDKKGQPVELARHMDAEASAHRLSDDSIDLIDSISYGILPEIGLRVFSLMTPGGNS
jgi:hypothetical protein